VPDLRGLYKSDSNVLSVEQCGDRIQINSPQVIHDFPHADGTLENGLDDVRGDCACQKDPNDAYCRIRISAEVVGNCFELKLNAVTTMVTWCKLDDGRVRRWTMARTTYYDPIEQIPVAIPTCFSSSPSRLPSSIPSHSPTDVSNAPSINPSRLPSSFPSSNPTRTPTSNPTRPPASAVRRRQLGEVLADDIPQYFTPKIDGVYSNQDFPLDLLSRCTEPLADGVPDLRGLYKSDSNVLSVEQCGDRIQINSPQVIHDFPHADGTLENGLDDVRGDCACQKDPNDAYCRIRISAEVVGNCFELKLNAVTTMVTWCKLDDGRVRRWTMARTTYYDPIDQIPAAIPTCARSGNSCMNWFGNNLDWSVIPYEQHSGSPWGFTPTGCTIASVQAYGAYHCGVLTASGTIQSCDGNDCFNGACSGFQESMDDYEYSFGEEEPPQSTIPSRLPSSIPSRPPSSNPSRPPASAVKRN